ncbi:hypothetical protein BH23PSE2_BH23PSE2_14510 [soil metagenome]
MEAGRIYRHGAFYADAITGQLKPKYLVVLATTSGGDIVTRLLTSRHPGLRPKSPPCHHGDPYPGFYLGTPGPPLERETWIDLRPLHDLDAGLFQRDVRRALMSPVLLLDRALLHAALECAAGAEDTTRHQERAIRDTLASLR